MADEEERRRTAAARGIARRKRKTGSEEEVGREGGGGGGERWMSMKIILWMRVRGAHLSRWRMELIKLSPHLPRRR